MPKLMPKTVLTAICVCAAFLGCRANAADGGQNIGRGAIGLGLNYPGLGIRYFISDRCALEAKGQADKTSAIGGLRVYDYFRPSKNMFLFWGVEADYISFKGEVGRGSGAAAELFGGFEYFALSSVSIQADFGPAYIYLKDSHEPVSASGLEYVANFGFNLYWGGGKAGAPRHAAKTNKPRKARSQEQESDPGGPWLRY